MAEISKLNVKIEEQEGENSKLSQELIRAQKNDESARLIDTRQQLRHMTKERDQLKSDKYVILVSVTSCNLFSLVRKSLPITVEGNTDIQYVYIYII